jgi:hypothetical protein
MGLQRGNARADPSETACSRIERPLTWGVSGVAPATQVTLGPNAIHPSDVEALPPTADDPAWGRSPYSGVRNARCSGPPTIVVMWEIGEKQ